MKKRYLLLISLLILTLSISVGAKMTILIVGGETPVAGYCAGQSWNTFTDFRLDFDNTDDNKNACLSSGTETGTLNNSATIVTQATSRPGSGGDALLSDANVRFIDFDNGVPYFQSQYGEAMFMVMLVGNNTGNDRIFFINGVTGEDALYLRISNLGRLDLFWEDHNSGPTQAGGTAAHDLDGYYGDWIQVHIQWDTTRCTDTGENCADAGEDEIQFRMRVDDNQDGDFGDGGAEDWSVWESESDATDALVWATEPDSNDVQLGVSNSNYTQDIYIDDVEISYSKPTWGS